MAEAAIKAAVATKDLSALIKACDRFYVASAAVKGLQTAAEWEFERGEFTMAARLWGQLADHPRAGAAVPEYLHHAASAEAHHWKNLTYWLRNCATGWKRLLQMRRGS